MGQIGQAVKLSPRLPDFPTPDGDGSSPVTIDWMRQWQRNFYERFYEYHREIVEAVDALEQRTGSWTPTITFATPGDLAVAYSVQQGFYIRTGRLAVAEYQLSTSAFTWTTSAGSLTLQGLPFAANVSGASYASVHNVEYNGISKAGYSEVSAALSTGTTDVVFDASGQGLVSSRIVAADVPSGGSIALVGTLIYRVT